MKNLKIFAAILAVALIPMGHLHAQSAAFKTGKALEVQYNILRELNAGFVDTIDTEKLINKGISAMLNSLDPYTEYIPDENEEEKEELLDEILSFKSCII